MPILIKKDLSFDKGSRFIRDLFVGKHSLGTIQLGHDDVVKHALKIGFRDLKRPNILNFNLKLL